MKTQSLFSTMLWISVLTALPMAAHANNNPHHITHDEMLAYKEVMLDGSMIRWQGDSSKYPDFMSEGFVLEPTLDHSFFKNSSDKSSVFFEQIYKPVDPGLKGQCRVYSSLRTSEVIYQCNIRSNNKERKLKLRFVGKLFPEMSNDKKLVWSNPIGNRWISTVAIEDTPNIDENIIALQSTVQ